jgi:hypothetical protein
MSKCPLVMVEWVDSRQPSAGWQWLSKYEPGTACDCASVGWLIHDGDDVKALAPNMADLGDSDDMQDVGRHPHPDASHPADRAARRAELIYFFFPLLGLSLACVSAEAAALFAAADDFGSLSTLLALDAALLDVCSFFAMFVSAIAREPASRRRHHPAQQPRRQPSGFGSPFSRLFLPRDDCPDFRAAALT